MIELQSLATSPQLQDIAYIKAQWDDVLILQTHAAIDLQSDLKDSLTAADTLTPLMSQQALPASFGAFNLGLHVGDDAAQVHGHRGQLLAAINAYLKQHNRPSITRLHWLNQVHGNTVLHVDSQSLSMQASSADAMVSSAAQCGLSIMTADCVPIVLYQPKSKQIAAIHAGWQGLANGIIKATADSFDKSAEIMAWIGACISQENYEVGSEVVDKLIAGCEHHHLLADIAPQVLKALISCPSPSQNSTSDQEVADYSSDNSHQADKYWVNLPKLASMQLAAQGIQVASDNKIPCSYTEPLFYSYRRQTHEHRPATGRMALVILRL